MDCKLPSEYTVLPEEECVEYGGGLSGGAIAGIVIGCALVAGGAIFGCIKLYRNYQVKHYDIFEHIEEYHNGEIHGHCVEKNYKSICHVNELSFRYRNIITSSDGKKYIMLDFDEMFARLHQ